MQCPPQAFYKRHSCRRYFRYRLRLFRNGQYFHTKDPYLPLPGLQQRLSFLDSSQQVLPAIRSIEAPHRTVLIHGSLTPDVPAYRYKRRTGTNYYYRIRAYRTSGSTTIHSGYSNTVGRPRDPGNTFDQKDSFGQQQKKPAADLECSQRSHRLLHLPQHQQKWYLSEDQDHHLRPYPFLSHKSSEKRKCLLLQGTGLPHRATTNGSAVTLLHPKAITGKNNFF